MSSYLYELPTTGAISFSTFYNDPDGAYISHIAQTTEYRASVRACLKEMKRFDDSEKDYLRLVKVCCFMIPSCHKPTEIPDYGGIFTTSGWDNELCRER